MVVTRIRLEELTPAEENVRFHTEAQLKEFERSVRMFGQIRPLVVDEKRMVLAGNGLFETLKRMGEEEADCYVVEGLTPNQKKKLMIADNKVYSLGVDNLEMIDKFISELSGDLDIPGFDEDVLRQMAADASAVTEELSTYGTLDQSQLEQFRQAGARGLENSDGNGQGSGETAGQAGEEDGQDPGQEDTGTGAGTGNYVICPKCGEKIWL